VLLVVSSEETYPLNLGPRTNRLPSGTEVVVEGERLQLRVTRAGVTVNDVEVHGTTALNAGDLLNEAGFQYLVLPGAGPVKRRPVSLLDHWTWLRRLEEEIASGPERVAILVGRSGAFGSERLADALSELSSSEVARHVVGRCDRNMIEVLATG